MTELYDAALADDLERVILLVEQGVDKNQVGGHFGDTALAAAAENNHFAVVQYLVERGADIDRLNTNGTGLTPLHYASGEGHLEVARYLLEQGADRDKADRYGRTPLYFAAQEGHLETTKLLMIYGADLNKRDYQGQLPIDITVNEEMKQAIRDEPRRRMDHGHKRATEQDRHPNADTSASLELAEDEEEPLNKKPRLEEGEAEEEKVEEEDEDSEPSDEEDED